MKRNCTRVKLKASNLEVLVTSAAAWIQCGWFESRRYAAQIEGDGSWSLTLDVLQEFHPLSKDHLREIELTKLWLDEESDCEVLEIIVIEYQNSKTPVIHKFDKSSYEKFVERVMGELDIEIALAVNGDIEAGYRVFEHVASIDMIDDVDTKTRISALLTLMKDINMLPPAHIIDSLRERFTHSLEYLGESDEMNAMQSWFDAACLKARSMLTPASTAPRRAATI